jgi:Iap family predicted aminopeptidase
MQSYLEEQNSLIRRNDEVLMKVLRTLYCRNFSWCFPFRKSFKLANPENKKMGSLSNGNNEFFLRKLEKLETAAMGNLSVENVMKQLSMLVAFGESAAGTRESHNTANLIVEILKQYGISTVKERFPVMTWRDLGTTIKLVSPLEDLVNGKALPYSPSARKLAGKLVFVGTGLADEEYAYKNVEGKVVLAEWCKKNLYRIKFQYIESIKHGALAFIAFDAYPGSLLRRLVVTPAEDFRFGPYQPLPIPALTISREDGLRIKDLLEKGTEVEVEINSATLTKQKGYDYNIVGTIPGDEHSEQILVTAHHDHWLGGASDNLVSVAIMLEIARVFPQNTQKTVKFISFGAEEAGGLGYEPWYWINGSRAFVKRHENEMNNTMLIINMDGIGIGEKIVASVSGTDLKQFILTVLSDINLKTGIDFKLPWTGSDHYPFLLKGIHVISLYSVNEYDKYYHSNQDSPDKMNKGLIYDVLRLAFRAAFRCAMTPGLPFKPTLYVDGLLNGDKELNITGLTEFESKGGRLIDFSREINLAKNLYEKFRILEKKEEEISKLTWTEGNGDGDVDRLASLHKLNRLAMNAYQILNRHLFSVTSIGSEYELNWVPMFFPGLNAVEDLLKIRDAMEFLKNKKNEEAIKLLSTIPIKRATPGTYREFPSINMTYAIKLLKEKREFEALNFIREAYELLKLKINLEKRLYHKAFRKALKHLMFA